MCGSVGIGKIAKTHCRISTATGRTKPERFQKGATKRCSKGFFFLFLLLFPPKPSSPSTDLFLTKGVKQRHRLPDLLRLPGQTQKNFNEPLLIPVKLPPNNIIPLSPLLHPQHEINLGTTRRHKRLSDERLEPDKISNNIAHHFSPT